MRDSPSARSSWFRTAPWHPHTNSPGMAVLVRAIVLMAVIATAPRLLYPASFGRTEEAARGRRFTVKDSIELSHIVNPERSTAIVLREQPSGVPIYSPDD